VRYVEEDPHADVAANIREIGDYVKARCAELALELPEIRMEPGRSIVADTAVTLYTVGSVKQIPGYRSYVAVDGGMTDNPRYALYGAKYTVLLANKLNEPADFACSLVGRCCESGDVLQENVLLPASVQRGDVVAMLSTGAYQYSMASNYNRIPRLPIVMVRQGEPYLAVRRETLADLVKCDL
jgi:diaminopimelate decarboxylase